MVILYYRDVYVFLSSAIKLTGLEMWGLSLVVTGFGIYSVTTYLCKEMHWEGFLIIINYAISLRN